MKEIPLTKGRVAIVDDDDFEIIGQWKWCLTSRTITHKGTRLHLGYYDTIDAAHIAYASAAKKLHGEFSNT